MKKLLLPLAIAYSSLSAAQGVQQDHIEYRQGYSFVLQQSWSQAQNYFSEFQSNWPDSVWADDAAFWLCYSIEQEKNDATANFQCYSDFISNWPESSWAADASSKLAILGANLAALGFPQYIDEVSNRWNFEFEFDSDEIGDSIERAMEYAEAELARYEVERERMGAQGIELPVAPPMPVMPLQGIESVIEVRDLAFSAQDIRLQTERVMRRFNRDQRNSADDELLTVMAALRNNDRAAEILVTRLKSSSNPVMRSRIVMLLEDVEGDEVTQALVDVIENDESNEVKADAVLVLLDRDEESVRDLLLELVKQPDFPLVARIEIIDSMEEWAPSTAIPALADILNKETELALISQAANSLAGIGSVEAIEELIAAVQSHDEMNVRREILHEIGDVKSPQAISFLTSIALEEVDDETAAIAIHSIAERGDNVGLAALDHIYSNTGNQQRLYAAIEGIGEVESQQAVDILEQIVINPANPLLQSAAVRALGDTNLQTAVPIVINAYRNADNEDVRSASIRALRRLDEYPEATEAMLEILEAQLDENL